MQSYFFHQSNSENEEVMSIDETSVKKRICESIEAARLQAKVKKAKRYRSAFTTEQINYLEKQFKKCPYIGNTSRKDVANLLNMPERAVKIWFQNRRMKEKKESNIKEPHLDRQNNLINNEECVNDQLDNVHATPSTNDRLGSLQLPISNHPDIIKCTKNVIDKKTTLMKADTTIQDLRTTKCDGLFKEGDSFKDIEIFGRTSTKARNVSIPINNLKKVNIDTSVHIIENDKTNTQNTIGKKKYPTLNGATKILGCQETPEDLSARNNCTTRSQNIGELNLGPAYSCLPFYNMQNYYTPCLSTGNVVWKPINVMPVLPTNTLSLAVPNSEISGTSHISEQKTKCDCNCHLKQPTNCQQGSTQPQYVIAIPYTSNSNNRVPENVS